MLQLSGHTKPVRAVAYSRDGRLISGGEDRTVRVWDVASGRATDVIRAGNVVYAVAVSPAGDTLAYAGRAADSRSGSNAVRLWDLSAGRAGGEHLWRMGATACSIWSLAFSADGAYLAAACRRSASANDLDGGGGHWWLRQDTFAEGEFEDDRVYAVGFAPSGSALALTRERAVGVLHGPSQPERLTYRLPASWAAAVTFTAGGTALAVAANSFLFLGDTTGKGKMRKIKTGMRIVTALAVSPDGRTLLAGGRPGSVECYDVATGARLSTYDFDLGWVNGLAFAPDGFTFAAGGDNGVLVCDAER